MIVAMPGLDPGTGVSSGRVRIPR